MYETSGSKIFISYRRDDAGAEAGRLSDDIKRVFGEDSVFLDVVGIQLGRDFRKAVHHNVGSCGVLLAVIGPQWAFIKGPDGTNRLTNANDYVRLEIATALQRDIPVIPVLVRGATLPTPDELPEDLQEMVYRNSVELTHTRWHSDVTLLITALKQLVADQAAEEQAKRQAVEEERRHLRQAGDATPLEHHVPPITPPPHVEHYPAPIPAHPISYSPLQPPLSPAPPPPPTPAIPPAPPTLHNPVPATVHPTVAPAAIVKTNPSHTPLGLSAYSPAAATLFAHDSPSAGAEVVSPSTEQSSSWYRRPWVYAVFGLLLVVLAVVIWGPFSGFSDNEILRLEGSTSVGDKLAPALATAYLTQQLHATDVKTETVTTTSGLDTTNTFIVQGKVDGKRQSIRIVSNGSGKAFTALAKGSSDLGMSSRPLSISDPPALSYLASSNRFEHVIALDGIAVIVNPANSIENFSIAQLRSIFTGSTTNWGRFGVGGGTIHCYGRDSSSGTFEMFRNAVVGKSGSLSAIKPQDQLADGSEVVKRVAADPSGIGYVTFTQATGVNVIAISDQGTQPLYPNPLTVSTEDYVLTRRLYLYQPNIVNKSAADFISFVLSSSGQAVVSTSNFVSVLPQLHSDAIPAFAPVGYLADIRGLKRLGLSFRFTSGQGSVQGNEYALDNLAQDNILRLESYIQAHPDSQITLLGFTDSRLSSKYTNVELSRMRAQSVANELSKNGINANIDGLGAEMPVATNDTPDGRAKNRRVEVWVSSTGP